MQNKTVAGLLEEFMVLLPGGVITEGNGFYVGVLLALAVKFREEVYNALLRLKDGDYTIEDVSLLTGFPLYAAGILTSTITGLNLGLLAATIMGAFLTIDGLVGSLTSKKERKPSVWAPVVPLFQGVFAPERTSYTIALPLYALLGLSWDKSLYLSSILSVLYLSHSVLEPFDLSSFFVGLVSGFLVLSLYKEGVKRASFYLFESLLGLTMLSLALLTL